MCNIRVRAWVNAHDVMVAIYSILIHSYYWLMTVMSSEIQVNLHHMSYHQPHFQWAWIPTSQKSQKRNVLTNSYNNISPAFSAQLKPPPNHHHTLHFIFTINSLSFALSLSLSLCVNNFILLECWCWTTLFFSHAVDTHICIKHTKK